MTHAQTLTEHFNSGLTISQMEATGLYAMPQLPRVIHGMKRKGWKIATKMRKTRTGKEYARYVPVTRPDGTSYGLAGEVPAAVMLDALRV